MQEFLPTKGGELPSGNIAVLAACQAFSNSGASMLVFVGGLIGAELAPQKALATLPVSSMAVGVAAAALPAALVLRRTGRKRGFMIGAGVGVLAALTAVAAIQLQSFPLFCLAAFLIGANNAFILQYRFGAVESAPPGRAGQAVSIVLVGGMAAAYLGPEIAQRLEAGLALGQFGAAFLALAAMYMLTMLLLTLYRDVAAPDLQHDIPGRPLSQVVTQPLFLTAVLAATIAYGVMSLVMTATPVQMHTLHNFSLQETAWVIQSHIFAMYLPSLFTGLLFARLSAPRVMFLGVVCLLGCVGLGLISRELLHYWAALVLLGVGWNLMFVAATVLLTQSYHPAERFRAQAVNDFTIFGVQALASLFAGTIIFQAGWRMLMWITLPVLFAMVLVLVAVRGDALQPVVR